MNKKEWDSLKPGMWICHKDIRTYYNKITRVSYNKNGKLINIWASNTGKYECRIQRLTYCSSWKIADTQEAVKCVTKTIETLEGELQGFQHLLEE